MKKQFIIYILSFFILQAIPARAVKTINANPVNLAAAIVEKVDSVKVQREFDYYGYKLHSTEDGFKVMKSPNGYEIRYSFQDPKALDNHPVVIVKTTEASEELNKRMKEMQFKKDGHGYSRVARRDDNHIVQCTPGPSNTLLFHCIKR